MKRKTTNKKINKKSIKTQIKKHTNKQAKELPEYEGSDNIISTGSTLLDLAISGHRFEHGGIPLGIMVEIFGPSSSGKTVLLSELAGNVQYKNGSTMFHDPEARLNKQFAKMFGLHIEESDYTISNTIPQVFQSIRDWKPKNQPAGIFCDSLAALSTDLELEGSDKMGARRAKEFSEELRKTCRIIQQKNFLLVCSNQVRVNIDASPYAPKYVTPGGESVGFYSSLRLQFKNPTKIWKEKTINKVKIKKVVGVETDIFVYKSSISKPYTTTNLTILFDYGIDDIRNNLQYIKKYKKQDRYCINGKELHTYIDQAIACIEKEKLEKELQKEAIELWHTIETQFKSNRIPKKQL